MDMNEILSNPVRMRILQYLQINREATAKQISQSMEDIPVPTLYRHINRLLDLGVLEVKEERKVRGTTERTLAISGGAWSPEGSLPDVAYQFLMSLYMRFREYGTERDPKEDRLCLRTCILRLTDESYDGFMREYAELLSRYMEPEADGKVRSVSFISAPVKEEEDD